MNFAIRRLLSVCVIFCPKTVRSPSLADSIMPVSTSSPKYSTIIPIFTCCPCVRESTTSPRINGGRSAVTMAVQTATRIPRESLFFSQTVCMTILPAVSLFLLICLASFLCTVNCRIFWLLTHQFFMCSSRYTSILHPKHLIYLWE